MGQFTSGLVSSLDLHLPEKDKCLLINKILLSECGLMTVSRVICNECWGSPLSKLLGALNACQLHPIFSTLWAVPFFKPPRSFRPRPPPPPACAQAPTQPLLGSSIVNNKQISLESGYLASSPPNCVQTAPFSSKLAKKQGALCSHNNLLQGLSAPSKTAALTSDPAATPLTKDVSLTVQSNTWYPQTKATGQDDIKENRAADLGGTSPSLWTPQGEQKTPKTGSAEPVPWRWCRWMLGRDGGKSVHPLERHELDKEALGSLERVTVAPPFTRPSLNSFTWTFRASDRDPLARTPSEVLTTLCWNDTVGFRSCEG
ncbi:uncharacterized protein LOC129051827 [Pongo abelii]|uniref:uncharacterized protein LOC129051827 n=1 Tax=Pongo abelii TaxID=9601 RepID=UPI003006CB81